MTSAGRAPSIQEGWQQRQATDTVLPAAAHPQDCAEGSVGLSAPCQAVLDAPGGTKSTPTACTQSSVCTRGLGSALAKSLDTLYIIKKKAQQAEYMPRVAQPQNFRCCKIYF